MKKFALLAGVVAFAGNAFGVDYFQDFEGSIGAEWSTSSTGSFNGTTHLGRFDNASATLTVSGLTVGELVTLTFDFYAFDSWDGNAGGVGPDRFRVSMNGADVLDSTFSNVSGNNQSYPDPYLGGNHAAQTGATDVDQSHGGTLPNGYYGNSLYSFGVGSNPSFSVSATSSTMAISFTGSNLQGIGDESWGIDNVHVTSVPEPGTFAAIGLGLAAIALRRKKA
ncbi:MAG TPA: PEP-CTERM sorting domain-containing protein [Fimbriimonadaceae bacterium]|nr:PEP-CTERM sorting domain-containing protein [Fimbriimonadaceae bacterium]